MNSVKRNRVWSNGSILHTRAYLLFACYTMECSQPRRKHKPNSINISSNVQEVFKLSHYFKTNKKKKHVLGGFNFTQLNVIEYCAQDRSRTADQTFLGVYKDKCLLDCVGPHNMNLLGLKGPSLVKPFGWCQPSEHWSETGVNSFSFEGPSPSYRTWLF